MTLENLRKIRWSPKSSQEFLALDIVKKLKSVGFEKTFFVGGYVRDYLLKRSKTGMIDIVTEAMPAQVIKIFGKSLRVIPTGIKHGTVTVHKGAVDIEITTFRTESKYEDWRRPESVKYIKDPKLDSRRRDFTINALYFDPVAGEILDFHNGLKDLENHRLNFVGSAAGRIQEDALRLMRAARFSTELNFTLRKKDIAEIRKYSGLIKKISAERVKQELDKIVQSENRAFGVGLLEDLGILKHILPEVDHLASVTQSKNYHSEGNVFVHTLLGLSLLEKDADLSTAYGLLFHDIGKGQTAKKTKKSGRHHVSFHGHQELGEHLTRKALQRLRFSNREVEDISWYVRHHHAPVDLPNMRKAKQMRWILEPRFPNLLKIFRADSLASVPTDKRGKKMKPSLKLYDFAAEIYKKNSKNKILAKKLISGTDVMKAMKIKSGPKVGQILRRIEEKQLEGKIKNKKQALAYLKKS